MAYCSDTQVECSALDSDVTTVKLTSSSGSEREIESKSGSNQVQ